MKAMTRFTWNDIVSLTSDAPIVGRRRQRAWVVGIHDVDHRTGEFFLEFPPGNVYTVEFEDGSSAEVHESFLELNP
jgi:hypothetical protein